MPNSALNVIDIKKLKVDYAAARLAISNIIAFADIKLKFYYNQSYKPLDLKPGQFVLLKLYKRYKIPLVTSKKIGI